MKAKTLLIGLMTAFAAILSACGGGDNSSKVPSSPTPSVPAPSQSTPAPSVSTPTPSVSTPKPSTPAPSTPKPSTPAPSVSSPAPSVSTPTPDPDPTPDPIVPDAPVDGNLFVAVGWEEADELQADVNEGANIVYWADTNWSGSLVTATTSVEEGIFSIDPTLVSGSCWHGLQTFINVPNNAAGDEYDVALTINSSVAGQITFNGQVIDLVEGRNDLKAHVTVANTTRWDGAAFITAPISIQFGVEGATGDANAVVQNGEYKLYNIVVLKTSSVNPDPTPDPDPNPDPEVPVGENLFVATDWEEADELQADVNEGANIVYWADTNWSGSLVTATTSVEEGIFSIDPTLVSGSNWFALQVFINVPNNAAGDNYDVALTINSSVAGQITFNGKVIDLVEGDNELSANVTVANTNRWDGVAFITAPISIQFGVEGGNSDANAAVQNGLYKLSNISIIKTAGTVTPDPDPTPDPEPEPGDLKGLYTVTANTTNGAANNFTIRWASAEYAPTQSSTTEDCAVNMGRVERLEYFTMQGDAVSFNLITGADAERHPSIILHTAKGDYKITMMLSGGAYVDYTVEKVECTHGTTDEPAEPAEVFVHTSGEFNYSGEAALGTKEFSFWNWRVQENLETPERGEDKNTVTSYDSETGTFHYKSYAEAGEWWHDQFFYKVGVSGNVTVRFTITVSGFEGETGEITINGQVFTVTNGVALDVEYTTFAATTISIQLGKNGGSNLTGYLDVTFANMSVIK